MGNYFKKLLILIAGLTVLSQISGFSVSCNDELSEKINPNEEVKFSIVIDDISNLDSLAITTDLNNPEILAYSPDGKILKSNVNTQNTLVLDKNDLSNLNKITIKIAGKTPDWKIIKSYEGGDITNPKKVCIYQYLFNKDYKYYEVEGKKGSISVKPKGTSMVTFKIDAEEYNKILNEIESLNCNEDDKEYLVGLLEKGLYEDTKEGIKHIGTTVDWTFTLVAGVGGLIIGLGGGYILFRRPNSTDDEEEIY